MLLAKCGNNENSNLATKSKLFRSTSKFIKKCHVYVKGKEHFPKGFNMESTSTLTDIGDFD